MPELPEVNTFQRYFDETSLHQRILEVHVYDDKIIRNLSGDAFAEKLTRRTFIGSYRRGKYLFGKLDNDHHLLLHFGMTGDLKYYADQEDQPRHERFSFQFDTGFFLGFDCARKFARILYIENLSEYLKETGLGEDAQRINEAEFLAKMEGKKSTVKGFLLNQSHLSGIGNLYADEICFQTQIHPASTTAYIPLPKQREIYQKMQEVLHFAVEKQAHYKDYPDNWLWQWRKEGATAPDGTGIVKKSKIAGRTTYFCEGWQKFYTSEKMK